MHNLLFCAHTLCMNYVTNTFLLVSSSVRSKQLLCFVHGQGQKREQKPTTKKVVGFHNHSRLLTMDNVFSKNDYNCDFVTRNTYRTEPNVTSTNLTPNTTVTILYATSKELLRLSLGYHGHSPTTSVLLTDPSLPYENY